MNFLEPYPDLRTTHYPEFFYKYIPFNKVDYIKTILLDNALYFSLPSQFRDNDALDCRTYNITIKTKEDRKRWIKDEIAAKHSSLPRANKRNMFRINMRVNKSPDSNFFRTRMDSLNQIIKDGYDESRVCILCVSDSSESIEMWKHYIPDGEGVCIKLYGLCIAEHLCTIPVSSSRHSSNLTWLRHVTYADEPLQIPFNEFVNAEPLSLGITLLYTKLKDFAFEQEWRFMIGECIQQTITFPPHMVVETILGPRVTDDQVKQIEAWNSQRETPFTISRMML